MTTFSGALSVLIDALERRRCLFWTGNVLVDLDRDFDPAESVGAVTMVLDAEDFAALKQGTPETLSTTLRVLARTLDRMDDYFAEAEQHLKAHGYEWFGRWRSPEEVAGLPVCKRCARRFDPDDTSNTWGYHEDTEKYEPHEAQ